MSYRVFSLNGAWEMSYQTGVYKDEQNPWSDGFLVKKAIPNYWEDMTDSFRMAPFFGMLRINPEYGLQRYPIKEYVPDMALPNIVGTFFYRRSFSWEKTGGAVELYCGGVQNAVSVWLNDTFVGRHEGYSTPFSMKISNELLKNGENILVFSVSNVGLTGYDGKIVSGLSNRASYQYTGGIYGDVELRVYETALRSAAVLVAPDCKTAEVQLTADGEGQYRWEILNGECCLQSGSTEGDFSFDTEKLTRWTPENPKLYTLRVSCENEKVELPFGVRRLTTEGVNLRLNGEPYYLRGICEHCYYPLDLHPRQDVRFYRGVIKKLKALGFNFIRFHTYVPAEACMQAADELGMLLQVECPNYASLEEWKQIVDFCRKHTSVVIYCCGNELMIDEPFLEHLRACAKEVHEKTDSLYSPMSALRGFEYMLVDPKRAPFQKREPFHHDAQRFAVANEFVDVYNSYTLSQNSYETLKGDWRTVDAWSEVYQKPRLSHEICIHGTYTDLSLKDRYKGTRVGQTEMFSSIEKHLEEKGLLQRAPLYFQNSSQWQWRVRKHCFENMRLSRKVAGFDFLGPIDTHWHTFGYDVGMMNEFYELKPGETVRNVRMYNNETVLLADLGTNFNFYAGEEMRFDLHISHFGEKTLENPQCCVRLMQEGRCVVSWQVQTGDIARGTVDKLADVKLALPESAKPQLYKLYITLETKDTWTENEWEIYAFPRVSAPEAEGVLVSTGMSKDALIEALTQGKTVLLLGTEPFDSVSTTFQIALAGRTEGNLATVIEEHPLMADLPHDGFCGWQFRHLLEGGRAVRFESDEVPFKPIVEAVSSHKFVIRQGVIFEYQAINGKLLVCGFHFAQDDPAANWLKARLLSYAESKEFQPEQYVDARQLKILMEKSEYTISENTNLALNPNDKTMNA